MPRKTIIAIATASVCFIASSAAEARPPEHAKGPPVAKIATAGIDLTAEQRALLDDIRASGKELRSSMEEERTGGRRGEWLAGYLSGELVREEVLDGVEGEMSRRHAAHMELADMWIGLLETYDEAQRSQVLENIGHASERGGEASRRPGIRHGPPLDRLLEGVELSRKQQKKADILLAELESVRDDAAERRRGGRDKWIEAFAAGELGADGVRAAMESRAEEALDARLGAAGILLDLCDVLDSGQREQVLSNLEKKRSSSHGPSRRPARSGRQGR